MYEYDRTVREHGDTCGWRNATPMYVPWAGRRGRSHHDAHALALDVQQVDDAVGSFESVAAARSKATSAQPGRMGALDGDVVHGEASGCGMVASSHGETAMQRTARCRRRRSQLEEREKQSVVVRAPNIMPFQACRNAQEEWKMQALRVRVVCGVQSVALTW